MRWTYRRKLKMRSASGALTFAASAALLSGACHDYPNVFRDDLPDSSMVTTVSAEVARQAATTTVSRRRDYEIQSIEPQDGTSAHAPLWLEDPFEMVGSEDGQFAVTGEDFLYFPYGICRFIVNVVVLPVSMAVAPPNTVMCSDGVPRRSPRTGKPEPYDAERCAGTTIPPDVDETWSFEGRFAELRTSPEEVEPEQGPSPPEPHDE